MDFETAEKSVSVWVVRLGLAGTIIGALWIGFQKYQAHEENTAHRVTVEPVVQEIESTVGDLVGELSQQRAVDEEFRQQALGTIREGFEKHDERIKAQEETARELKFIVREQRTLQQLEKERIDKLEDSTVRQIEALRDRPIEVVIPAPPPAPTEP